MATVFNALHLPTLIKTAVYLRIHLRWSLSLILKLFQNSFPFPVRKCSDLRGKAKFEGIRTKADCGMSIASVSAK